MWVELIDDSLIRGDGYIAAAGTATVRTMAGQPLSIRTAAIRAVRFRDYASAPQLAQRWQEISAAKATGDSLVIRRGDNLEAIARSHGVALNDLLDWNNLDSALIVPGQELFVPGARLSEMDLNRVFGRLFIFPTRGRSTSTCPTPASGTSSPSSRTTRAAASPSP